MARTSYLLFFTSFVLLFLSAVCQSTDTLLSPGSGAAAGSTQTKPIAASDSSIAPTGGALSLSATCQLDVCFVLDQSCSMPKAAATTFIKNVVNELSKEKSTVVHYSAFGFSETSQLSRKRISSKATFLQSLDSLQQSEFDSFQDAFRACIGEVKGKKQNIFVISDGFKPQAFAAGASAKAPQFEFNIFSIGVGTPANEQYLKGLASKSDYYSKVPVTRLTELSLAQSYIETFGCSKPKSCPLDHVCFALDQSGSIWPQDWEKQKKFVVDIAVEISNPNTQTQYSAIKFNHVVQNIVSTPALGVFTANILSATQGNRGTNINAGLTSCFNLVKSGKGTRSIILLTDGRSGNAPVANQIKQAGISLVAIGIGNNVDVPYLKDIASDPDSEFYVPADFANLDEKVAAVAETTCTLPKFTPSGPAPATFGFTAGPGAAPAAKAPGASEASLAFCDEGEC